MKQSFAKIYLNFVQVCFKQQAAYKFNFWVSVLVIFNSYFITYLSIWVIFQNVAYMKGWTYEEVVLIYTLNLLTYGIACFLFLKPMERLEELVKSGEFDLILVRPIHPFLFLILKEMDFKYLGHIFLGTTVLMWDMQSLNLDWTLETALCFALSLIGGVCIQSSFLILTGVLSIKYVSSGSLGDLVTYSIRRFVNYPLDVFGRWIVVVLTFFIPYGFVNYYPVKYLLAKNLSPIEAAAGKYGAVFVGILCAAAAGFVYRNMLRQYSSTGN